MIRRLLVFALFLIAIVGGVACNSQPTPRGEWETVNVQVGFDLTYTTQTIDGRTWVVPKGMDLDRFPVRPSTNRRLTWNEATNRRLHLGRALAGTVLWNEDPRHRAFWLEILSEDRKVWLDENDQIVYIEDCGNRAMKPLPIPKYQEETILRPNGTLIRTSKSNPTGEIGLSTREPEDRGGYRMPDWLRWLWDSAISVALATIVLMILAAILAFAIMGAVYIWQMAQTAWAPPAPVIPPPPPNRRQGGGDRRQSVDRRQGGDRRQAEPVPDAK